jgi:hypothetical protein
MTGGKKYLRRPDIDGLVIEIEEALLQIVRQFLEQVGMPYEVLDAPPEKEGSENTRRRRGT